MKNSRLDAVVVGAGFSGLYMLHRLRSQGLAVRLFEAGSGVGGTWFWNRYPGARCDIESIEYSYSFSEELQQQWEWSERYPSQPELLRYLEHVADRFELRGDIQLETKVVRAEFDEASRRWTIRTERGNEVTAKYFITAVGCLSTPKVPELPGLEHFAGPVHHTGRWPAEGVDTDGKSVGVIGTGSSGIQAIPALAESAGHLTVFQRTPNFSVPARNRAHRVEDVRGYKAEYGKIREDARASVFGVSLLEECPKPAAEFSPAEQRAELERRWELGGLTMLLAFADTLASAEANAVVANFIRDKIEQTVDDPETSEALTPTSYPIGCRRLCLDTDYYETFNRDDVTLVDLRKTPLEEITATGLRTSGRAYALDVLVLATGFDAMTGALNRIDIQGRGGTQLREKWEHGPRSYLGLTVEGFPNMFTITGPLSPSVLSNMVTSIEQHVEWISDAIAHMEANRIATMEAEAAAEAEWVDHSNMVAGDTVFTTAGCQSWYLGSNIADKPRTFAPYPGGVGLYGAKIREVAEQGYAGLSLTPA